MESHSVREPRVLWSFWIACGLAVTGGIAPLLLTAGGTDRIGGVVIPFGIAAVAMAVNALTYERERGRPLATSLYFLAGIALVYGMLAMVAVPLRLAVIGTCGPLPAACPAGFERPFTDGETTGFAIAIAMGTLSIFVGFFGLLTLVRIPAQVAPPAPTRRHASVVAPIAPVASSPPSKAETQTEPVAPATSAPEPPAPEPPPPEPPPPAPPLDPAAASPVPAPIPAHKPRAKRAPKAQAELPPPVSPLELPAPSSPTEPSSDEPSST